MKRAILFVAALAAAPLGRAAAQLTLADALRQADQAAFGNRISHGSAAAQSAQRLAPLAGILPSLRFEAGYVKTNDPIGVFGSSLRQRAITPAAFDPQRLNYPAAVANYQGGIVVEQPIFNADAWTGRRAANMAADASHASEEWTRLSTRVDVIRAYYGAVLATERARTLESAARAAHAHLAQAEAMVRQGLVTKSDALLASVRAGDVDAQLAEAQGGAQTSSRQLAVLLGRMSSGPADVASDATLPSADRIRSVVGADTATQLPQTRADVEAADRGVAAARADELRARSTWAPRLNAFARYDWNSAQRLYAGDRNWTAGIMASWTPFAGARDISDAQAASARAATALAQADAAAANAQLEADQTRIALTVALTRLAIAERAADQSAEAHRIVEKKYQGGLATIAELLDAQATATQNALALSQARWSAIVADAERLRALGRDPTVLVALDDGSAVAESKGKSADDQH